MRKSILWTGIAVFVIGVLLFFLGGASFPKIPGIYGSNQTYWIFLSIIGIVGLFLKKKK